MLVASLAREHTETAIKHLAKLMLSAESEAAQVQAANALLDRGWGKPAQEMTINEGETSIERLLEQFTDSDLAAALAGLKAIGSGDNQGTEQTDAQEGPDRVH